MGKIRIKTFGDEEAEKKAKQKKEEKKKTHLPGMGGGERVVVVGPTEEELEKIEQDKEKLSETKSASGVKKKAKFKKTKHTRSKKYIAKASMIDKSKNYPLNEAIELLGQMQSPAAAGSRNGREKTFDETVELHLGTTGEKILGQTKLPHGTGKKIRVAIASDELIAEIEKGKIDFDVLLSSPSQMQKLAKVAKILGPKGLMPNPKNGTITNEPEKEAKKYEGGQVYFKTETKAPIMHLSVGKMSFGPKKLSENIDSLLSAIKKENITKAVLKSSMSPAIKVAVDK